jgi:quinoprotein glucose dehydrogenase
VLSPKPLRNQVGAGNVWAPMAVDVERGILYAPTTSPSPDFWGGQRTERGNSGAAVIDLPIHFRRTTSEH